jgi:KRAB domain-containing zinc finger protein
MSQTEVTLQKHLNTSHSGIEYSCLQCTKSFNSDEKRKVHNRRRHREKTEKCEDCNRTFTLKGLLNAHIKSVHKKEKDKICAHCGETFFLGSSFKSHVLRHTNDRKFPCEVCGKSFLTKRDIKTHMGCHTLPLECEKCNKRFSSKFSLDDHVKMKHDGIKTGCRFICGYTAWYKR